MAKKQPTEHIYRHGAKKNMLQDFKERYGTSCVDVNGKCVPKYKYVYGSLVGKLKRNYGY